MCSSASLSKYTIQSNQQLLFPYTPICYSYMSYINSFTQQQHITTNLSLLSYINIFTHTLSILHFYYQLQHLHSKTTTTIINIHIPFISYTHYTYHTIIKYSINTPTTKNIHYSIYKHNYTYINIYLPYHTIFIIYLFIILHNTSFTNYHLSIIITPYYT